MTEPQDHFAVIKIRDMAPLPEQRAHPLVPRYALEPEPRGSSSGDSAAQMGSIIQVFNNNLANVLVQIGDLQDQIDGFEIVCNGDGTLSWSYGGDE